LIKAADMMIARRADTKARADFATWKMMAKLNGASALPAEAQDFLAGYNTLLKTMREPEATEATINLIYRRYYAEMGGAGIAPDVKAHASDPVTNNVTAFRRPPPQRPDERAVILVGDLPAAVVELELLERGQRPVSALQQLEPAPLLLRRLVELVVLRLRVEQERATRRLSHEPVTSAQPALSADGGDEQAARLARLATRRHRRPLPSVSLFRARGRRWE